MPTLPAWLSKQELITFLIILVLILALPIAILEIQRQKNLESRAQAGGQLLINDGASTTTSRTVELKLTAPWPAAPAGQSLIPKEQNFTLMSSVYAQSQFTCTDIQTWAIEPSESRGVCNPDQYCVQFSPQYSGDYTPPVQQRWAWGWNTSSQETYRGFDYGNRSEEINLTVVEDEGNGQSATCSKLIAIPSSPEGLTAGCFNNWNRPWPKACDGKTVDDEGGDVVRRYCDFYDRDGADRWANDHNDDLGCPDSRLRFGNDQCQQCGSTPVDPGTEEPGGGREQGQELFARVGKWQQNIETDVTIYPNEDVYLHAVVFVDDQPQVVSGDGLQGCTREVKKSNGEVHMGADAFGSLGTVQARAFTDTGDYEFVLTCGRGQPSTARITVTNPPSGEGETPQQPPRLAKEYRVSNFEDFRNAPWESYTNHPTIRSWILTAGAGQKTVYVQFRDTNGIMSDPTSSSILYEPAATAMQISGTPACFAPERGERGNLWTLQVRGDNFGASAGILKIGDKDVNVTTWEDEMIEGTIARSQMPAGSQIVTVTRPDGEVATATLDVADCGRVGPVTLSIKAKLQRKPENRNGGNFTIVILGKDDRREKIRGQRRFRNSGEIAQTISGLQAGTRYIAWINAPGHLAKAKEFVPTPGPYTLDFGELTTGDIAEDNVVNTRDYTKLVRGWSKTPTPKEDLADLDGNLYVNSSDYSILLINFNKDGDEEPGGRGQ